MRITSRDSGITLDLTTENIQKFQDVLAMMVICISAYNAITVSGYNLELQLLVLPKLAEINALLVGEYKKFVPNTEDKDAIESEIAGHTGTNSVN